MQPESILSAAIAHAAAQGALLFEPDRAGAKTATLTCAAPDTAGSGWNEGLSTEALFARWLRVNGTVLPLPESTGLWASLPAVCRDRLVHLSARACIPLVHDMKLAGLVFVLGGSPWTTSDPRFAAIEADLPAWAGSLGAAQTAHGVTSKAALVSRSNRLSLVGYLPASAAHEVRNPLATVRSMVQLVLSNDAPASEHDRLLTTVLAEVDRVNDALSRMLTLGRSSDAPWMSFDVSPLVTDAVAFCQPYAHRRGQTITYRCVTPASVRGDQHELRQVLVNVLLNACQASAHGAAVDVEGDITEAGHATIAVRDQGSGMTPELLARAFEPFYSTKQDGGGLGLAISRDIVLRHGGDIVLQSCAGTGTTVTLRLPLGDPHGPHSGG